MPSICAFSVIDAAALRIDDRLRVAKERREEADKQQGKRGLSVVFVRLFQVRNPDCCVKYQKKKTKRNLF